MKRILKDKEFVAAMVAIEKETAKIFGVEYAKVTASWAGENEIVVKVNQ